MLFLPDEHHDSDVITWAAPWKPNNNQIYGSQQYINSQILITMDYCLLNLFRCFYCTGAELEELYYFPCQRLAALLISSFDVSVLFHQKKMQPYYPKLTPGLPLYRMKNLFGLETLFYFSGNKREILKGASIVALYLEHRNEAERL